MNNSIISLFSGCGGLDLGFENAGFKTIFANEYSPIYGGTFSKNFSHIDMKIGDIRDIRHFPDANGIIGGPPCQSFSVAGSRRGGDDARGQLMDEYIRVLHQVMPSFFVVENVYGLPQLFPTLFSNYLHLFSENYNLSSRIINMSEYDVPQTRVRIIIVGIRRDLHQYFVFPEVSTAPKKTVRNAIENMPNPTLYRHGVSPEINAHEFANGSFSRRYMSQQRVLDWDKPAHTIYGQGIYLHPSAKGKMIEERPGHFVFLESSEPRGASIKLPDTSSIRRLSIRECARIQTFPDNFHFFYKNIRDGYQQVGNAVPPLFAQRLAKNIKEQLENPVDWLSRIPLFRAA